MKLTWDYKNFWSFRSLLVSETQRNIFTFPFKLNWIWSCWQFSFRFGTPKGVPFGVQKRKKNLGEKNDKENEGKKHSIQLERTAFQFGTKIDAPTEKCFRNLIKSHWNQIVFTIYRLIWNNKGKLCVCYSKSIEKKKNRFQILVKSTERIPDYPINAERFLQHLLSERLRLSA